MTFKGWKNLLQENNFNVDLIYTPRLAVITILSLVNSFIAILEKHCYESSYSDIEVPPPIFVLGAMRTGTTHLRNLLSQDNRFAFPTLYQTAFPLTFLLTERIVPPITRNMIASKRLVDNVKQAWNIPSEEEYAILILSRCSPYIGNIFPEQRGFYERYFSFDSVGEQEINKWKSALELFIKKLTWKYQQPLILKSPAHTGKVKWLLELFPSAKFISIHRHPFKLFQSARAHSELVTRTWRLQNVDDPDIDSLIIQRYKKIYEAYFRYRNLIPQGNIHEISFDALNSNPLNEIQGAYEALNLPEFSVAKPSIIRYLESVANYRKNTYPDLSQTIQERLRLEWEEYFQYWGYT